jgi:hypothetical protein
LPQYCDEDCEVPAAAGAEAGGSLCEAILTRLTGVGAGIVGRDVGEGTCGGWSAGAGTGTIAGEAAAAAALSVAPYSSRINWFTRSELSAPQLWQTKRTGRRTMSGLVSKPYFIPQLQTIFMSRIRFGVVFIGG